MGMGEGGIWRSGQGGGINNIIIMQDRTLASLQCRDGTYRSFTDQADITCSKFKMSCGVLRVA